jgi:hypothetical protein
MCSSCTSDQAKIAVVGQAKLQVICIACGKAEQATQGPNPVPVNQSQWSAATGLQGRSAYRLMNKDGVAVRVRPAFPGERTKTVIAFKEVFQAISVTAVNHVHTDGRQYQILFYQLADGRGWVHDFSTDHPGQSSVVPEAVAVAVPGGFVAQPGYAQPVASVGAPVGYAQPLSPGQYVAPPGQVILAQPVALAQPQPDGVVTTGGHQPGQVMLAQPVQPRGSTPVSPVAPIMYAQPTAPVAKGPELYQCTIKEGIALRKNPAYPGEKTTAVITHNQKFSVISTAVVNYAHNGTTYPITFYQLEDGRGWAHNFSINEPGKSTVVPC